MAGSFAERMAESKWIRCRRFSLPVCGLRRNGEASGRRKLGVPSRGGLEGLRLVGRIGQEHPKPGRGNLGLNHRCLEAESTPNNRQQYLPVGSSRPKQLPGYRDLLLAQFREMSCFLSTRCDWLPHKSHPAGPPNHGFFHPGSGSAR